MRPKVPDTLTKELEEEVNDRGDTLLEWAGYNSKTHFIVEAVREKISKEKYELEQQKNRRESLTVDGGGDGNEFSTSF